MLPAPNVAIELVSIPQTVDLTRKEADIFLSFFNPKARGLKSALFGKVSLFLYCSPDYVRRHGLPAGRKDLQAHAFVGYIDDLLAIHAVRWLDEVIAYSELLANLVARDLRTKYRGSFFGIFWSLLNPLLLMLVYTLVFSVIVRVNIHPYAIFLLTGLVPWNAFAQSLRMEIRSGVDKYGVSAVG